MSPFDFLVLLLDLGTFFLFFSVYVFLIQFFSSAFAATETGVSSFDLESKGKARAIAHYDTTMKPLRLEFGFGAGARAQYFFY